MKKRRNASVRRNVDSLKLSGPLVEWRTQWQQLAMQAWSVESSCRRLFHSSRGLPTEQIEELRAARGEEARGERDAVMWQDLASARHRVHALVHTVRCAPSRVAVEGMVKGIGDDLKVLAEKSRQQFEELALEENSLSQSISFALERFEGWCKSESAATPPTLPAQRRRRALSAGAERRGSVGPRRPRTGCGDLTLDESAIRARLGQLTADMEAGGGDAGTWPADEHAIFLKIFTKFRRVASPAFLDEAHNLLPHLSRGELASHTEHVRRCAGKQAERRHLLEQWKGLRAAAAVRSASESCATGVAGPTADREQWQRTRAQEEAQRENAARREAVAEWRQRREEHRQLEEEERQRKLQEEEAASAAKQRHQQELKRRQVEDFRQRREAEKAEVLELGRAQTPQRSALDEDDRLRIAQRSAEKLERQRARLQARRAQHESLQLTFEPPPRGAGHYRHVASRLGSHTKQYVGKARALREQEASSFMEGAHEATRLDREVPGNFAHQALLRPTRSCPSWRPGFGV